MLETLEIWTEVIQKLDGLHGLHGVLNIMTTGSLIATEVRVCDYNVVTMKEIDFKLIYSNIVVNILAHYLLDVHMSHLECNQRF